MLKFGIGNLRRLFHVEPIALKPITLLVGRNSSGKSTFLRTFPLLRQSLLTRTSTPILWYGDQVDFGSFETSLSRQQPSNTMSFSFVIDSVQVGGGRAFVGDEFDYVSRRTEQIEVTDVSISLSLERRSEKVGLAKISGYLGSLQTEFSLIIEENRSVSSLVVNGRELLPGIAPVRLTFVGNSLLPELRFLRTREIVDQEVPFLPLLAMPTATALIKLLRGMIDQRIGDRTIKALAARLLSAGPPNKLRIVELAKSQGLAVGKTMENFAEYDWSGTFSALQDVLYASWMPDLMRNLSSSLRNILTSTLYIGPMRARSERYYRYQDLAISEIDPDGKNFPMFLNSLSDRLVSDFSDWVQGLFGYGIEVSKSTGHLSINLTNGSVRTNIVDVGYGVSQILPVLGQIWWARYRTRARDVRPSPLSLIAIEQPELHLHPAHQALLADALIGDLSGVGPPSPGAMHYLVETHSETLVNRFGELIATGRINASDVQVVIFETDDGEGTKVRTVSFDESGALIDWPYGFFQPLVMN